MWNPDTPLFPESQYDMLNLEQSNFCVFPTKELGEFDLDEAITESFICIRLLALTKHTNPGPLDEQCEKQVFVTKKSDDVTDIAPPEVPE